MTSAILGSSVVGDGVVASATPYPWPYHGRLDPTRTALVACLDPEWRTAEPSDADIRLVAIAVALHDLGGLVVSVCSTPRRAFLRERRSLRIPEPAIARPLPPLPGVVLEAGATSAFYASPLDDVLRRAGCTDLILAGWGLEGPVHSTLRAANDRGYECLLVSDASRAIDPDLVHASNEMVRFSGGIFGAFAATKDVLAALGGPIT